MNATTRLKAHLPAELASWLGASGDDVASAWRTCPHAHWLIHLAAAVGVDRGLLVHAAADVANAAVAARQPSSERAKSALRTAQAWLDGRARSPVAWASGFAAAEAADAEENPAIASALRSAAFVAFACDDDADASYYAHQGYAAKAAEEAARALRDAATAATRVRARIPLAVFLDAFEIASQPPPPLADVDPDATTDSFYA